jgi:hypothetical protein
MTLQIYNLINKRSKIDDYINLGKNLNGKKKEF